MHFDLAHAIVSAGLMFATIVVLRKSGYLVPHSEGGPRWSWPLFLSIFVVMFIFNLIWPNG